MSEPPLPVFDDDISFLVTLTVMLAAMSGFHLYFTAQVCDNVARGLTIFRGHRSFESLRREYGHNFNRAYRMNYTAFNNLLMILLPHLIFGSGRTWAPNGIIPPELRLASALWYFAGKSALDIIFSHHMSHTEVYNSIWMVVDAVNATQSFDIQYPKSHHEQKRISREFISRSKAGFSNCAGCIDGILIWMEKPSEMDCKESGVGLWQVLLWS